MIRNLPRETLPEQLPTGPLPSASVASKGLHVPAGHGQAYWVMGHLFTDLVTGAESGGRYFSVIVNVAPDAGPPPHRHQLEEEQFYVLEGEVT